MNDNLTRNMSASPQQHANADNIQAACHGIPNVLNNIPEKMGYALIIGTFGTAIVYKLCDTAVAIIQTLKGEITTSCNNS